MSKTIIRPDNHESCLTKAAELLQSSAAFLIITVKDDAIRIGASVSTSQHDEMISAGMMEFIKQRELEFARQKALNNNKIH